MTKRRLTAFFFWCSQFTEPPEDIEAWFHKFNHCLVPHMNLNDDGMRRLKHYLENLGEQDLFTEAELHEMV